MIAISIRQPWASLIVAGRKTIELRSWNFKHRGPLVILAGGAAWKGEHEFDIGPMGVILGVVDVIDCRPAVASDIDRALIAVPEKPHFSWILANARPCRQVPFKGRLGIIEMDPALLTQAGLSL